MESEEFRETGHSSLAEFRTGPSGEVHAALVTEGNRCGSRGDRELPLQLQLFRAEARAELSSAFSRLKD